jgi:hypothetical protein
LQDTKGEGDVLLLEWSAPPEAPYSDVATWKWASPHWSERREKFLKSQLAALTEPAFRTQFLNQWVSAVDGWIPQSVWAQGFSEVEPVGAPDVVAVEVAMDGSRFAIVSAYPCEEGVVVRSALTKSSSRLWEIVEELQPKVLLLPPQLMVHYRGRKPAVQVGVAEIHKQLVGVGRALAEGKVLHSKEDQNLTDHVTRAVAVNSESGLRLSTAKSSGPIEATRALVWAVGEVLRPSQPRPKVRAG